jgi:quercetin dioxygenase-like cupin family protein
VFLYNFQNKSFNGKENIEILVTSGRIELDLNRPEHLGTEGNYMVCILH